jgi:sarcosine oxidase subunit gamma
MLESLRRQSPVNEFLAAAGEPGSEHAKVQLAELPFFGHLNLRCNPEVPGLTDAVQRCLGVALPLKANTVSENGTVTALWLGPDEWLLVTSPGSERELIFALRGALQGFFIAVTDLTDGQTILRISGDRATDVLYKGCSLDFHASSFGPGCCAQSHVDKIGVLIRYVDATPSFDLIVRRRFSEYLALWLKDAATEYGFTVI